MRWAQSCLAASSLLLVGLGVRGAAQTPAPPESTLKGVFTGDQAKRGEESYMNICVGCHAAGTYVGPQFLAKWEGKPLSEFFELMSEKMPKDDPGSLELKEYAQIVAYILRQNKMPEGKAELPPDAEVLKKIKFEVPKTVAGFHPEGTKR
jgi:mono/diheme cytochrome c family protein